MENLQRGNHYEAHFKRLVMRGINRNLAQRCAFIISHVDGYRRRSNHEQSLMDRLWLEITNPSLVSDEQQTESS